MEEHGITIKNQLRYCKSSSVIWTGREKCIKKSVSYNEKVTKFCIKIEYDKNKFHMNNVLDKTFATEVCFVCTLIKSIVYMLQNIFSIQSECASVK